MISICSASSSLYPPSSIAARLRYVMRPSMLYDRIASFAVSVNRRYLVSLSRSAPSAAFRSAISRLSPSFASASSAVRSCTRISSSSCDFCSVSFVWRSSSACAPSSAITFTVWKNDRKQFRTTLSLTVRIFFASLTSSSGSRSISTAILSSSSNCSGENLSGLN
uniref:Uncharacterized protein n=1 Tax=Candidatus Methanogaster sp. ANME-2c ERB4 TaxID=2759911 RepID=A0A7G9Y7R5_9EURY|nr:hypothetical protein GNKCNBKI_00001 [Methanosarcinales archaeon ANME-2c ERB4]QNO44218.1 hypothetical protein HOCEHPEK_00002 [Methanosarcinales archaeon ANME-2c ERB4]QNO44879.1 hypothetical protein ICKDOKBB_00002 [Methanosarcinales archaeon ANME-2c ERB4]QNO46554.1 hypothetical protein IOBGBDGH_00002 [Methanosarcinales archaeon ANME-2c ERB4]